MKKGIKEAFNKIWLCRLYVWIRDLFKAPCTWKDINIEMDKDDIASVKR